MESVFLLIVIVGLSFSCFRVSCSYDLTFLESAVDIEVAGNCTVRSGVNQYTVYGNSSKLEYINCMAKNDTGRLQKVAIEKNGELLHDIKEDKNAGLWYKAFDGIGEENDGGTYTCRAIFEIENQAFSTKYYVEKDVEVLTVEQSYVIASDVGSRVYAGEEISIDCQGFYETDDYVDLDDDSDYSNSNIGEIVSSWKPRCPVYLIGDPCPTVDIPLDRSPMKVTCDLRPFTKGLDPFDESLNQDNQSACSKPIYLELDISPQLSVTLEPSRFDAMTKELNFVCTSDPPRLMYWTILTTDNSRMFDIQKPPAISADTEIHIKQEPGRSTLKIQIKGKDNEGGNGIQTVICSTYDTKAHVIKTAQLGTLDEHGSTSATLTTDKVVSLSVTALLSVVIVVLLLVVIFMCLKMRQIKVLLAQSPAGCSVDDDKALPQPVLHGNPTYAPCSGTHESPP